MGKIINIICHPSFIVLYFKDKIYKIILLALSFFIVLVGILALYSYTDKYYNHEYVNDLTKLVANYKEELDLEYNDSKLSGSSYVISKDEACLVFLKDVAASQDYAIFLVFKEDRVVYYYESVIRYELEYKSLGLSNFTFKDIQDNNYTSQAKLSIIIDKTLELANPLAQTYSLLSNAVNLAFLYFMSILIAMMVSFFVNPAIEFKYRINICIYDSIIFFVVMLFGLLFNITWFKYIALLMPAIYSRFSFKSIVRIR